MMQILHGDCLSILPTLDDNSIDAIVTDPPYHLTHPSSKQGNDALGRISAGFMNCDWDGGDIAFRTEIWSQCLRVLKPGGYLAAFGGSRTHHRLWVAIEDAGFEIRDTIMWVHSQGFPKSKNVAGAIDKYFGHPDRGHRVSTANRYHPDGTLEPNGEHLPPYEPVSEEAKPWAGFGTALKPSHEPICLARKPLIGTVAENVLAYGTGGLNIAKTRIMTTDQEHAFHASERLDDLYVALEKSACSPRLAHDFVECMLSVLRSYNTGDICLAHDVVDQNDSSPYLAECEHLVNHLFPNGVWCGLEMSSIQGCQDDYPPYRHFCDEHAPIVLMAARDGIPSLVDVLSDIVLHQSSHKHNHVTGSVRLSSLDDLYLALGTFFLKAARYLSRRETTGRWPANLCHDGSDEVLELFPCSKSTVTKRRHGGRTIMGDPVHRADEAYGYLDEGSAARFFYCSKASKADRAGSKHPTVKSVKLIEWLAKMICPPGGIVLDPFAGSGTTGQACRNLGFDAILIEREAEYVRDIHRRLDSVTIGG